jgi:phage major head subunit gpT-like protein
MPASVSVANTGAFSQLISRDFKSVFFDEYKRHPEEYKAVANMNSMDGAYQREGEMVGFHAMQEIGEGQPVPYDNFIQGNEKTIFPSNFALAFAVTENMWDDDQKGHIKKAFKELGKAAALTKELKFWDIFNSGFVTTKRTGIDGKALFATDHGLFGSGETYANRPTTGSSLNVTSLQAAMNRFEKMKNDRGIVMPMKPKLLIVPPELRFEAEKLLKSEYNPENANSQVNTVGNKGLEFMVGHYLTSTTGWFLVGSKEDHDLRFITRKPLQMKSYDDFATGNAVFKATMRFQTTFVRWRGVDGNTGA